jgi:hypothetical protein
MRNFKKHKEAMFMEYQEKSLACAEVFKSDRTDEEKNNAFNEFYNYALKFTLKQLKELNTIKV